MMVLSHHQSQYKIKKVYTINITYEQHCLKGRTKKGRGEKNIWKDRKRGGGKRGFNKDYK